MQPGHEHKTPIARSRMVSTGSFADFALREFEQRGSARGDDLARKLEPLLKPTLCGELLF